MISPEPTTTVRGLDYLPAQIPQTVVVDADNAQAIRLALGSAADWTADEIRAFVVAIASTEAERQAAAGNPADAVLVDGSPKKPFSDMNRNVTVMFQGGRDARPAMDALRAAAKAAFPKVTWIWVSPNRELLIAANTPKAPVLMGFGDRLMLVPRGPAEIDMPKLNQYLTDGRRQDARERDAKRPLRSGKARRAKGGMATVTAEFNRGFAAQGFRAGARFSERRASAIAGQPTTLPIPPKGNWRPTIRPVGRDGGGGQNVPPRMSSRTGQIIYWQGIPFFTLVRRIR